MINVCSLYNDYAGNFCLYKAYFTISRRVTRLLANLAKKFAFFAQPQRKASTKIRECLLGLGNRRSSATSPRRCEFHIHSTAAIALLGDRFVKGFLL